ncbi:MAG TPA: hypothetical protein PKM25_00505 [Candidatus Ozemobacteraceae bacterium]|nr:hypothetical protein [Candidatus Ozemobacteraceae bacterium]
MTKSLLLIAIGLGIQLFWSGLAGAAFIIIGFRSIFKSWTADPKLQFKPEFGNEKRWISTGDAEIARLHDKIKAISSRTASGCIYRTVVLSGYFFVFLLVGGMFGTISDYGFGYQQGIEMSVLYFGDVLLIFFLVYLYSPATSFWKPNLIETKLPVYDRLVSALPAEDMGDWKVTFQLELCETRRGDVPVDIRLMLRPPDAPAELIGIQAQIAINMGAPYLYFVVIARLGLAFPQLPAEEGLVFEQKESKDVNILVVRQYADSSGGYNTDHAGNLRLLSHARDIVTAMKGV